MAYTQPELIALNRKLRNATADEIFEWTLAQQKKTVVTTKFGPYCGVMLRHIHLHAPRMPMISVDHEYNTQATYRHSQHMIDRFNLNVHFYTPRISRQRREALGGGVPALEDRAAHSLFTRDVKLEPFDRAFAEHQPEIWIAAIRQGQTSHRQSLDVLSIDPTHGCLKVAPFFYWSDLDMEEYLVTHDLPIEEDYYDPTKVNNDRECGLHLPRENVA